MRLMSDTSDREIERIISLMQRDESFDAPSDAIRWSKNLFRARAAERKKSVVEKVLAVLQMDLSPNRAAFGERSASASPAKQMLFQAGTNSLDLRIKPEKKGSSVRGQILGAGFADCSVELFNDHDSFQTRANQLSEFSFTEIPNGKYDVRLQSGEKEITIKDLELK